MSPEFQKRYKTEDAYSIVCHIREHYNEQAAFEGFKVTRLLFNSKMEVGTSLVQYALQMYNHIKRLDQLGHWMDPELSIDLILARLPDSFAQFVLDYEMVHKIPTIPYLINVLEMDEGKMAKKKGKETTPKETSSKGVCFHCGQVGHWKRNCKAYLESKNKVACDAPSSSGIYVIEVNNVSYGNLWVLDTGCGSHICTDMQGLRDSRKLTKGESDLRVGNGVRVAAIAIGTYVLNLPSGFCLYLDNCFCVPALTKNIIYVSCLNKKGFHLKFGDNSCCIMLNDVFYAGGTLSNGIYILDMSNPILNINDGKRQKGDNFKSSYLWHCRLGHTSVEA